MGQHLESHHNMGISHRKFRLMQEIKRPDIYCDREGLADPTIGMQAL